MNPLQMIEIFENTFRTQIDPFVDATGIFGFDNVKFDDYLIEKHGDYMDGKTSMKSFILRQYGDAGVVVIEALIGAGGKELFAALQSVQFNRSKSNEPK